MSTVQQAAPAVCPDGPEEWIDVVILALDDAWRTGASPKKIIEHSKETAP